MAKSDLVIALFAGSSPQGADLVYTLNNVNMESYSCSPVLAEDGMTVKGSAYHITGTALLNTAEGEWDSIRFNLGRMQGRVHKAEMSLTQNYTANHLIEFASERSNIGGPFINVTANQVVGSNIALVHFDLKDEVSFNSADQGAACDLPVVAHTWTQAMSLDAVGMITRTVNGILRVARASNRTTDTAATKTDWYLRQPVADLFRRAIIPGVPGAGWRRESQAFAYDMHSTALVYSFVDKQNAHALPDGVKSGDMDFTYERTAQDPGVANLRFTCDLEADMREERRPSSVGPNRRLVEAAVALSKTRINAQFSRILITRMAITEQHMLSRYAIRFELEAQAYAGDTTATNATIKPIAFMVGAKFKVNRTEVEAPDPYGSAVQIGESEPPVIGSYRMVPHYINNLINGMDCQGGTAEMPQAAVAIVTNPGDIWGPVSITVFDDQTGISGINEQFKGMYAAQQNQPQNEDINGDPYANIVSYNTSITNCTLTTGMVRLSTMYNDGGDLLFQTKKPLPIVRERVEICKAGSTPGRLFRQMPTKAFLIREDWNVSAGKFDAQGNRLYTGVYEREFGLYDDGTGAQGFINSTSGYAGIVRRWNAPIGYLSATMTPTQTTSSQQQSISVFGNTGTSNMYAVPPENFQT
jgi:hypothetical protein